MNLVEELKSKNAWFATAGQAVAWFRKRRSADFAAVSAQPGVLRIKLSVENGDDLPGLRLRVHTPSGAGESNEIGAPSWRRYTDAALQPGVVTVATV